MEGRAERRESFSITIEKLGVHWAALSIIGQMGESFGFILFSRLDDFDAYVAAADAIQRGVQPEMPPHFALNFDRGADLSPALRKEIAQHGWEVAGADAFPWLVAVDEDLVARPPTSDEVTIAEAVALALTTVLREEKTLARAWDGGPPVTRALTVQTYAGEIEVALRAPYEALSRFEPPFDLLANLFELGKDGEEIDGEARRSLEDELVQRFVSSPEAAALGEIQSCHFIWTSPPTTSMRRWDPGSSRRSSSTSIANTDGTAASTSRAASRFARTCARYASAQSRGVAIAQAIFFSVASVPQSGGSFRFSALQAPPIVHAEEHDDRRVWYPMLRTRPEPERKHLP